MMCLITFRIFKIHNTVRVVLIAFFFFELCSEELTAVTSHLKVFQLKNTLYEQQVKCFRLGVD